MKHQSEHQPSIRNLSQLVSQPHSRTTLWSRPGRIALALGGLLLLSVGFSACGDPTQPTPTPFSLPGITGDNSSTNTPTPPPPLPVN
ncbi:MAG: hypothetical protein U0350_28705 [Caldilineaceae bacterium]